MQIKIFSWLNNLVSKTKKTDKYQYFPELFEAYCAKSEYFTGHPDIYNLVFMAFSAGFDSSNQFFARPALKRNQDWEQVLQLQNLFELYFCPDYQELEQDQRDMLLKLMTTYPELKKKLPPDKWDELNRPYTPPAFIPGRKKGKKIG